MSRVSKAELELVRKMQRQTNADRIRAMSDEEMAEFIYNCVNGEFWRVRVGVKTQKKSDWLDWLKQEVEE